MKRFGQVIKLRPEYESLYKALHKDPWPEINDMIKQCNIQNYSIYHLGEYLFAYFEYVGDDYEADMAKMAADPRTNEWWAVCKPCQQPLNPERQDEWWTNMEEVYHLD